MNKSKKIILKLLQDSDIEINGNRAFDPQVKDESFYKKIISKGSIGLGEAYMHGLWECEALDEFFYKILNAEVENKIKKDINTLLYVIGSKIINKQTKEKSKEVAKVHYDIGNNLYKWMLDERMIYSCAYWEHATNLNEAQEAKLELICRKLDLKPGLKLLDIGCGWGGLAKYAAEKYNVSVVGITLSKEQVAIANEVNKNLPVEIRLMDYRDVHEKFDRIVSVGMFEHVGHLNYLNFIKLAHENLTDDGIFLLHTIGTNDGESTTDPWINKYIFPNGKLPSIKQIAKAIEGYFVFEDWHNFGLYYDRTCMEWLKNFKQNWEHIKPDYSETFYRMWVYYLSVSAASFRARNNHLWQIVLTKKNRQSIYHSIR
jgi:cyclopropane-fatty-acyl-phospholipid synthase